jgi:ketosteroid isomerase-like protein
MRGNIPTFQQLFSPEVVWHEPGKSPVSGDFKGIQELLGLFGKTLELSAGTFKLDLHDLLVSDEHAEVLSEFHDPLEGDLHVERHRVRGGVDLDTGYLRTFVVETGLEGDDTRLVGLNETPPSAEGLS